MKTDVISFRLRKELDSDLSAALAGVDKEEIKNLCRNGLRLMLGIKTTRSFEVQELPLVAPTLKPEQPGVLGQSKPAVFIPTKKRS
jgi:hypothetical protein